MFLHVSVILFTGGWYPSMHCRWYPSMPCSRSRGWYFQAYTQGGSWGVWPRGSPGPHLGGGSPGPELGVGGAIWGEGVSTDPILDISHKCKCRHCVHEKGFNKTEQKHRRLFMQFEFQFWSKYQIVCTASFSFTPHVCNDGMYHAFYLFCVSWRALRCW